MKKFLLLLIISIHLPAQAENLLKPKNIGIGCVAGATSTALCAGVYHWAQKNIPDKDTVKGICVFVHILFPLLATAAAISLIDKDEGQSRAETRYIAFCVDLLGGLFLPTSNLEGFYVFLCKFVGLAPLASKIT